MSLNNDWRQISRFICCTKSYGACSKLNKKLHGHTFKLFKYNVDCQTKCIMQKCGLCLIIAHFFSSRKCYCQVYLELGLLHKSQQYGARDAVCVMLCKVCTASFSFSQNTHLLLAHIYDVSSPIYGKFPCTIVVRLSTTDLASSAKLSNLLPLNIAFISGNIAESLGTESGL